MSPNGLRITDGIVTIRAANASDIPTLIAGRDEVFHRWLGEGAEAPNPFALIEVADEVVGWLDYDRDREWLLDCEVNVGYNIFAPHRGKGYATRSLQLLLQHLSTGTEIATATLLIDTENHPSLAVAQRAGFQRVELISSNAYYKRSVPERSCSDGVVAIRRREISDLEAHLDAIDDQQIQWLWLPGQREQWQEMTMAAQHAHCIASLTQDHDSFGRGPKWCFSIVNAAHNPVGYIDCDLANEHVPHGEANISYAVRPSHRRMGYATRAVALVSQFLAQHTGAERAHLIVDTDNVQSISVARRSGAVPTRSWINDTAATLIDHELSITALRKR